MYVYMYVCHIYIYTYIFIYLLVYTHTHTHTTPDVLCTEKHLADSMFYIPYGILSYNI